MNAGGVDVIVESSAKRDSMLSETCLLGWRWDTRNGAGGRVGACDVGSAEAAAHVAGAVADT